MIAFPDLLHPGRHFAFLLAFGDPLSISLVIPALNAWFIILFWGRHKSSPANKTIRTQRYLRRRGRRRLMRFVCLRARLRYRTEQNHVKDHHLEAAVASGTWTYPYRRADCCLTNGCHFRKCLVFSLSLALNGSGMWVGSRVGFLSATTFLLRHEFRRG